MRAWKNIECNQRALPVDDLALDSSNSTCNTKEQTIEKDYVEQEKMTQMTANQQEVKKQNPSQNDKFDLQAMIKNQVRTLDTN